MKTSAIYSLTLRDPFLGHLVNSVELQATEDGQVIWDLTEAGSLLLRNNLHCTYEELQDACMDLVHFFKDPGHQSIALQKLTQAWESASPAEQRLLRLEFDRILEAILPDLSSEVIKQYGLRTIPGQSEGRKYIPWQHLLRRFVQSRIGQQLRNTNKRPSKRYGTFPGNRRRGIGRLGIAIDTSGSISSELLATFFEEVKQIDRLHPGIRIAEFDHRIQRSYRYDPSQTFSPHGGGGTRFGPPLRWADLKRLEALIIFTDGQAAQPGNSFEKEILWIVHGQPPTWMHEGHSSVLQIQ